MAYTFSNILSIDCIGLTKDGLFKAFAAALEAEDWFGANLDALYDLLTDREDSLVVDLVNWDKADLTPADRLAFESLFEDAVEELEGRLEMRVVARRF